MDKGEPLDQRRPALYGCEDAPARWATRPYDVRASIAHAAMLRDQELLSAMTHGAIETGLDALAASHAAGEWEIGLEDEDVHTGAGKPADSCGGEAGKRIHLVGHASPGRVALRLYPPDVSAELEASARAVAAALTRLGTRYPDLTLPGYTHMQHGMPSSVASWAEGSRPNWKTMRRHSAARRRISRNPLGSAAGYGNARRGGGPRAYSSCARLDEHRPVTAVQLSAPARQKPGWCSSCVCCCRILGKLALT